MAKVEEVDPREFHSSLIRVRMTIGGIIVERVTAVLQDFPVVRDFVNPALLKFGIAAERMRTAMRPRRPFGKSVSA